MLILPQRQTVLVAQQAADVDLLSHGRLRLGVGTGWNWVEYHALGQDFASRGRRLSTAIGVSEPIAPSGSTPFCPIGVSSRRTSSSVYPKVR